MKVLPGPLLGPKKFHEIALRVRAALDAHPEARVLDIAQMTGASQNLVARVRRRWVHQRQQGQAQQLETP